MATFSKAFHIPFLSLLLWAHPGVARNSAPTPIEPVTLATDEELKELIQKDLPALGSVSLGFPSGGLLLNGKQMASGPHWTVVDPRESWGTEETIAFVEMAISAVAELHPGTPKLSVGDISRNDGGRLNRHITHQAGRDADLGFYFTRWPGHWRVRGTAKNLDLPRNWTLLRALLVHCDVETVLLDRKIQQLLHKYALSIGEDPDWLARVFQVAGRGGHTMVRHVRSHHDHFHIRFYNRHAQEMAIRAYQPLLEAGQIKPPVITVAHKVSKGQTLGHLAMRYGVSVAAIRRANSIKGNSIRAGRAYRIPVPSGVASMPKGVDIPERCLPPFTPESLSGVDWTPADHPQVPAPTPVAKDPWG